MRSVVQRDDPSIPHSKFNEDAARRLLKIFQLTDSWDIVIRITALYLIERENPRQFKNDQAFRYALVYAVRKFLPLAEGFSWNKKLGKVLPRYKPLPQRTIALMGAWLADYSGTFTAELLMIAELNDTHSQVRSQTMRDAFKPLKDRIEHRLLIERRRLRMSYKVLEEVEAGTL